jgi:hypothetical protein
VGMMSAKNFGWRRCPIPAAMKINAKTIFMYQPVPREP